MNADAKRGPVTQLISSPGLWVELVRAGWAHSRREWWKRPPFLPLPDRQYMRWRRQTAYGQPDARIRLEDLVDYLSWRRQYRREIGG